MKISEFEQELSVSLLSDEQLKEEIESINLLLESKITPKKVLLKRDFLLSEEPNKIYSRYSEHMFSVLSLLEGMWEESARYRREDIIDKWDKSNKEFGTFLQKISLINKKNKIIENENWEEESLLVENKIFKQYTKEAFSSYLSLFDLKGSIIDLSNISFPGFKHEKKFLSPTDKKDTILESYLDDIRYMSYYNIESKDIFLQEDVYKKTIKQNGEIIFIYFSLIPLSQLNVFNNIYNSLMIINKQMSKNSKIDFQKIEEINQKISNILKKYYFVSNCGFSLLAEDNENKNNDDIKFLAYEEQTYPILPRNSFGKKWMTAFIPTDIKKTKDIFLKDYELFLSYKKEFNIISNQMLKTLENNNQKQNPSPPLRTNFNPNYNNIKPLLNNLKKKISDYEKEKDLIRYLNNNNFIQRNTYTRLDIVTILKIMQKINIKPVISLIEGTLNKKPLVLDENILSKNNFLDYIEYIMDYDVLKSMTRRGE